MELIHSSLRIKISVADPDPNPDPHVFDLLDPYPVPLVRGMDPDLHPSIIVIVTSF